MLLAKPANDVRSIGNFLIDSGYNAEQMTDELELVDGLFANGENLEPLLMRTEGDTVLPVLARLFFLSVPVEESCCIRVIPENILSLAMQCGLLERVDGNLESAATLAPFRQNLVASDCLRVRHSDAEMVVGPGSATHFIARLAAGGENETTLDLGCGSGVLAAEAAAYSRHVIGTDINPRSLQFAAFTSALNGIANTEFLCGDGFVPVKGRQFSRVIANPPFFLSPTKKFTYSDSPLELDGFARRIAKEAPQYLEDGGYFQMICQWVQIAGESWEQRITEWTADSGCDVMVLLAPKASPITYAELRDKEARQAHLIPEFDFASRVKYLRDRNVQMIYSGVITMRKRLGRNWFKTLGMAPAGERVGHGIRERFNTITFLATNSEAEIFETRFRFASEVQLRTVREPGLPDWKTESITLIKSETLVDQVRLDQVVADCLPLFDGQRTLREVSETVATRLGITTEESQQRCLQLVRRLLQGSFVVPA